MKSAQIRRFFWSVFSPFGLNTGKYGPEKTAYLDTFHALPFVVIGPFLYLNGSFLHQVLKKWTIGLKWVNIDMDWNYNKIWGSRRLFGTQEYCVWHSKAIKNYSWWLCIATLLIRTGFKYEVCSFMTFITWWIIAGMFVCSRNNDREVLWELS